MRCLVISLWMVVYGASSLAEPSSTSQPEHQIGAMMVELTNIRIGLKSSVYVSDDYGIGGREDSGGQDFDNARRAFESGFLLAAIRYLNSYLNQTQVPLGERFLESQYMLGMAYYNLLKYDRAARAFARYLAAYMTEPVGDPSRAVDMAKHLLVVAAKYEKLAKPEVAELASSLTVIDLKKTHHGEVLYYTARILSHAGLMNLANEYYQNSIESMKDPALVSKARYYLALAKLRESDTKRAMVLLGEVAASEDNKEYAEYAKLALARLLVRTGKTQSAMDAYRKISPEAHNFDQALFERIFLAVSLSDYQAAASDISIYFEKYPNREGITYLRTIKSYVEMKQGNLNESKSALAQTEGKLSELKSWLKEHYAKRDTIAHSDLIKLAERVKAFAPLSETTLKSDELFKRLSNVRSSTSETRGVIRNLIYTYGRMDPASLFPYAHKRYQYLAKNAESLFKIGHRAVEIEKHLFADRLNEVEVNELGALLARRQQVLKYESRFRVLNRGWQDFFAISRAGLRIYEKYLSLKQNRAQFAAALLLGQQHGKAYDQQRADEVFKAMMKAEIHFRDTLERLRFLSMMHMRNNTSFDELQSLLKEVTQISSEENAILSVHRDALSGAAHNLIAEDMRDLWKMHDGALAEIYMITQNENKELKSAMWSFVRESRKLIDRHNELRDMETKVHRNLQVALGNYSYDLTQTYQTIIDEKMSKMAKWNADIEWILGNQVSMHRESNQIKLKLEEQILKQGMHDYRLGGESL